MPQRLSSNWQKRAFVLKELTASGLPNQIKPYQLAFGDQLASADLRLELVCIRSSKLELRKRTVTIEWPRTLVRYNKHQTVQWRLESMESHCYLCQSNMWGLQQAHPRG